MPLLERILAPVAVTLLHVVLVAVVVHHCEYMLDPKRTITILEWFLVTFTAAIYYRTVIADPGVLRLPKTLGTTSSEGAQASVLGATGVPSAVRRGKGAAARDARDWQESLENLVSAVCVCQPWGSPFSVLRTDNTGEN